MLRLKAVITAAAELPVEKRGVFLERVGAHIRLRDPRRPISDLDLDKAVRVALTGLIHSAA